MVDPTEWTEEAAEYLASQERFTLTDAHWEVVRFMRSHFDDQVPPDSRLMVLVLGERYGKDKGTLK